MSKTAVIYRWLVDCDVSPHGYDYAGSLEDARRRVQKQLTDQRAFWCEKTIESFQVNLTLEGAVAMLRHHDFAQSYQHVERWRRAACGKCDRCIQHMYMSCRSPSAERMEEVTNG